MLSISNIFVTSILVAEHLTAQRSAIRMVAMRVRLVVRAVAALRSGELPPNAALLREARALAHRLPLVDNPNFTHHFYNVLTLFSFCYLILQIFL